MFYCPDVGRFLSRDLIRRPGANSYAFANNDPLDRIDAFGLIDTTLEGLDGSKVRVATDSGDDSAGASKATAGNPAVVVIYADCM